MAQPLAGPGEVEPTPISFAQEDLWYVSRLAPLAAPYNEVAILRRSGPLDIDALSRSFDEVVRRHNAWRTTFPLVGERPVQLVGPPLPIEFPVIDLGQAGRHDPERDVARVAGELAGRPYDLEHGPTLRPFVVRLGDEDHRIYLAAHHLVFDCLSLARVAVPELITLYEAAVSGLPPVLAPALAQYRDYTAWERNWVGGPPGARRLEHWRHHLAGAAPPALPLDRPRREHPRFRGGAEPIRLPAALAERVRAAGLAASASTFQILAAGLAVLLHQRTGHEEVIFATAADLRRRRELEPVLGFAATWLAIRADLSGKPTFATLVRRLRDEVLEGVDMAIPFGQVVAALHLKRGSGVNPLLRVLLVLNPAVSLPSGWDLDLTDPLVADAIGATKLDLQIELQERPTGEIDGRVIFDTDLFDRATVRGLIAAWPNLLDNLVGDPDAPLTARSAGAAGPETAAPPAERPRTDPTTPLSELERDLVGIWARILGIDKVGVHDDFFDLGGRSLLAVEMLLEVEHQLGATLPVTALLDAGATIAGLAALIEFGEPATDQGTGPTLVFVWPHEPAVLALRHLRSGFDSVRPAVSLVVPDGGTRARCVPELADELLAEVRRVQPTGPYLLAGFSLGGLVAYEMAAWFRASGEQVVWLALLDIPTPQVWRRSRCAAAGIARLLDRSPSERRNQLAATAHRWVPRRNAENAPSDWEVAYERQWSETLSGYTPEGHDVPMDLFVSHSSAWHYRDPTLGWSQVHAGALNLRFVPGDHGQGPCSFLTRPYVEILGERVAERRRSLGV